MSTSRTALWFTAVLACAAYPALGNTAGLPDWSGQWENEGATPSSTGGMDQSLDSVLQLMKPWGTPPLRPAVKVGFDQIAAALYKQQADAAVNGLAPNPQLHPTCTWGVPQLMIETPLMFEAVPSPKETVIIFSGREIRHIYTDARPHTAKEDLWPTPWGDSIGHWEGATLVVDTIQVESPLSPPGSAVIPIIAFGGNANDFRLVTFLSAQAQFVERIRKIDADHLEDRMTITDPRYFTAPWHITRVYRRVTRIHRMVHEDCEGEERNPVVDGKYTLTPPPAPPAPPVAPATSGSAPR